MTIVLKTLSARPCGAIDFDADGVARLRKRVEPAKHQLRKPPAWAVAAEHLEALRAEMGEAGVVELMGPAGERWTATVGDFDRSGFTIERGNFEPQRALQLRYWRAECAGGQQLALVLGVGP